MDEFIIVVIVDFIDEELSVMFFIMDLVLLLRDDELV